MCSGLQNRMIGDVSSSSDDDDMSLASAGDCAVCCCDLDEADCVKVRVCGHVFHERCILECWTKTSPNCPVCRRPSGAAGKCPSGTMEVVLTDRPCPGFGHAKTIEIRYSIPGGTQKEYHDHPGQAFSGDYRVAYLPTTLEGCVLLCRLRYAWRHGLSLSVGTSQSSGRSNVLIWSTIPHKTSLGGGTFGFPDPNYINKCNAELDKLGVPPGKDLLDSVRHEIIPYIAPDKLSDAFRGLITPVHVTDSKPPARS